MAEPADFCLGGCAHSLCLECAGQLVAVAVKDCAISACPHPGCGAWLPLEQCGMLAASDKACEDLRLRILRTQASGAGPWNCGNQWYLAA